MNANKRDDSHRVFAKCKMAALAHHNSTQNTTAKQCVTRAILQQLIRTEDNVKQKYLLAVGIQKCRPVVSIYKRIAGSASNSVLL